MEEDEDAVPPSKSVRPNPRGLVQFNVRCSPAVAEFVKDSARVSDRSIPQQLEFMLRPLAVMFRNDIAGRYDDPAFVDELGFSREDVEKMRRARERAKLLGVP